MSTLAKLSKQAAQLEHDKHYQKALALYARAIDEAAGAEEEVDVALFNRAGDVAMRVGDAQRAVSYYERAIDGYATGGLLNNAIAVCNKLLRHAPEHAATHYTLAVLHAKQGFRGDAKYHYVEYADRMHRAGRDDEALRALGEFAALCPAGVEPRVVLSKHLSRGNRGTESAVHLEALLARAVPAAGPSSTLDQPAPVGQGMSASGSVGDPDRAGALVFLDVSMDASDAHESIDEVAPVAPIAGLEFTAVGLEARDAGAIADLDLDFSGVAELEEAFLAPEPGETLAAAAPAADSWGFVLPISPPDAGDAVSPAPSRALADVDLVLDTDLVLDDFEDLSPVAIPSGSGAGPRWSADLPGELPPLSLAGWIGSAMPAVLADARAEAPNAAEEDAGYEPLGIEPAADAPRAPEEEFVDLGAWLRASEPAPTTRMTVDEAKPTGDEAADFDRLLGAFKAGIARNVDADDHAIHYDLGVAFREMGLIDEAIAEFQRAARAPGDALRAREALGQCFLDRGSPELALSTLSRALDDRVVEVRGPLEEPSLLGVVYLLGEAHARLGQHESARVCFERVVATDIEFRDAARRLTQLSAPSP